MREYFKRLGKSVKKFWKENGIEDITKKDGNKSSSNSSEGEEMSRVAFIQSGSGTITLLIDKEAFSVGVDHPNYHRILRAMDNRNADELKIQIQEGLFLYDGLELHNTLTERIMKLMLAEHSFEYMVNFLNNLMDNPSGRAVQELYSFLDNKSLPITEDGCFLAYKSVKEDWTDHWSGTIDNSVGQTPSVPRNRVDDNCEKGCSYGLHAGAIDYVSSYHGHDPDTHVVIVKINPKDVVSVPTDCECTKIRVCTYEVVDVYEGELKEVLYRADVGNVQEVCANLDNIADHWYSYDDYDIDGENDGD